MMPTIRITVGDVQIGIMRRCWKEIGPDGDERFMAEVDLWDCREVLAGQPSAEPLPKPIFVEESR